jgi:uncharacterized protein
MKLMRALSGILLLVVPVPPASADSPFNAPSQRPEFAGVQASSLYLPARDGVRIALDLLLPGDLPSGRRIPALLKISRFGRSQAGGGLEEDERFWVEHGYARVLVDERGTGASFGTSGYGPAELDDLRDIVDWVVHQPWSNGRVGATGVSIEGTSSELLALTGHPAVRAVAPWFSDYNYFTDVVRPGGIFDAWVVRAFGDFTRQMDAGTSARRVEADADGSLLKAAVEEHRSNLELYGAMKRAEFSDDLLAGSGRSLMDISIPGVKGGPARVPMLILASWFDAGTAQGALQRFRDNPGPQRIFIGAWSHGAGFDVDPFAPGRPVVPDRGQQRLELLQFFDSYLKGASGAPIDRRIDYFTVGEGRWHSTAAWPPPGLHNQVLHLNSNGSLSGKRAGSRRQLRLEVVSTGERNRWHTQVGGETVDYSQALPAMEASASFRSEPLRRPLEITGQAVLRLHMACSSSDPSLIAYLTAVDARGKAYYLTEGHLRLMERKADPSQPTLHTYRRGDAQPVPADREFQADLTLLPVSALLPESYRLQILLAAGDGSTFETSGAYSAILSSASRIELPAREWSDFPAGRP